MIERAVFIVSKFIYWLISSIDVLLKESKIFLLSSISGFISLFIGALIINILIIGIIYYFSKFRK